jgi:single-strand DNA-binding protein
MLKTIVFGNVGNDAEIRATQTGMSVISFSVAHSEKWKDAQGQVQERTTWVRCSLWRKPDACGVAQCIKKGTKVLVEGQPSASAWLGNDGTAQAALELRVTNLELGGGTAGNGGSAAQSSPQPYQAQQTQQASAPRPQQTYQQTYASTTPLTDDDDLPF